MYCSIEIELLDVNSKTIIAKTVGKDSIKLEDERWIESYSESEEPVTIAGNDVDYITSNLKSVVINSVDKALINIGLFK